MTRLIYPIYRILYLKIPEFSLSTKTTYDRQLDLAYQPCYHAIMIQSFWDQGTEDIFNGVNSRAARRTCPNILWRIASRKLDQLDSVESLSELRLPPGNRLEALSGDRIGQYSIRINNQYRICFFWQVDGPADVEIVDYH